MSTKQNTSIKTVAEKKSTTKNQISNKDKALRVLKQKDNSTEIIKEIDAENTIEKVLKHAAFLEKAKRSLDWYDRKLNNIIDMEKENELSLESLSDEFSIIQDEDSNPIKIKLEKKVGYRGDEIVSIEDPRVVKLFLEFLSKYFLSKKDHVVNRILEEEKKYKS